MNVRRFERETTPDEIGKAPNVANCRHAKTLPDSARTAPSIGAGNRHDAVRVVGAGCAPVKTGEAQRRKDQKLTRQDQFDRADTSSLGATETIDEE